MSRALPNPVEAWFGADFPRLHPLLQDLHRHGGTLAGPVAIRLGRGLAGWLGRCQAARMGVPAGADTMARIHIDIRSDADCLHWNRTFEGRGTMKSTFTPVGRYPTGHWIERVGAVRVELGVDIVEGGWHWRPRRVRLGGVPMPGWLAPRITAHKDIVDGRYRFVVATALPGLGTLLSYQGDLATAPAAT